jgi:hypothetical protein
VKALDEVFARLMTELVEWTTTALDQIPVTPPQALDAAPPPTMVAPPEAPNEALPPVTVAPPEAPDQPMQ